MAVVAVEHRAQNRPAEAAQKVAHELGAGVGLGRLSLVLVVRVVRLVRVLLGERRLDNRKQERDGDQNYHDALHWIPPVPSVALAEEGFALFVLSEIQSTAKVRF